MVARFFWVRAVAPSGLLARSLMLPLQPVMLRAPVAVAEIVPLKVRTFEPLPEL